MPNSKPNLNIVSLEDLGYNSLADVAASLRVLAANIESGDYGEVSNLAWVMNHQRDGDLLQISYGLQGKATSVDCVFNTLLDLGKMKSLKQIGDL